jgi:hypothetical protein
VSGTQRYNFPPPLRAADSRFAIPTRPNPPASPATMNLPFLRLIPFVLTPLCLAAGTARITFDTGAVIDRG